MLICLNYNCNVSPEEDQFDALVASQINIQGFIKFWKAKIGGHKIFEE